MRHPSRAEDDSERAAHDFDDLYNEHAPVHTIAAGADVGRLAPLAALGTADVSALEKLVLADARCHYVVLKVVANSSETQRMRLYGHTLIFPQEPSTENCGGFNAAVLRAALGQVRIQFVGPNGERGKLERAALQLDDLRLRPEVVYNWLQLRAVVSGADPPPPIEEIAALINPPGAPSAVEQHVCSAGQMASVVAAGLDRAAAGSDVAGVRVGAQCAAHGLAAMGEEPGEDEDEPPLVMQQVGVLAFQEQEMDAVIEGIVAAVKDAQEGGGGGDGDGGDGGRCDDDNGEFDDLPRLADNSDDEDNDVPAAGAAAGAEPGQAAGGQAGGAEEPLQQRRGQDPLDDYDGAAAAILSGWWSLLPLARGVAKKPFERVPLRALFLYFDNRFARDQALLYHCANTKMRHDVNKAVGAKVKSNGEAFRQFTELVADPGFLAQLEEAQKNPKGRDARQVLKRVVGFVNLAAKSVGWGTRERAAEMTKLMADHRNEGAGAIFYSIAPDDVHSMMSIRYAEPFVGYGQFPHEVDSDTWEALRGQTAQERTRGMDEPTLQVDALRFETALPRALALPCRYPTTPDASRFCKE